MDFMSVSDLFLECFRSFVLILLVAILLLRGKLTTLGRQPGWRAILTGFCLIALATLLDITDEIAGLEKYIIIGDTAYEAFLEKVLGYLLGYVLILIGFYRMIPSLQVAEQNERAFHESEERFRKIFTTTPDPVLLTRMDTGAIVDANPAFVAQSGLALDEVLGKNSMELDLWADPQKRIEFRKLIAETGSVENLEADFKIAGGELRTCLLSAVAVQIGGESFILIVIRDITRIKQAERALQEISRIKSQFISTAAHELRTPLTVLMGYAELLTSSEEHYQFSAQKKKRFLEEILAKSFVLNEIINDLMDLSRMEAGFKFDLKMENINPDELLRKIFAQFKNQFPDHRYLLTIDAENSEDIVCDSRRITQVLENLMNNAVKYSPPGSLITLSRDLDPDAYVFSITDRGLGMTADEVEKVFDAFYRVDSSNTAVPGLGLGLSIVKQIVDLHGGSITLESTLGEGTCVTVRLPKTQAY